MHDKALNVALVAMTILVALFAAVAFWRIERKINYRLQYKAMVQETVREMVKPEALK
jgi:hypothetical protein